METSLEEQWMKYRQIKRIHNLVDQKLKISKTKWKHKQWRTTMDDMLQDFNACTNQNVKENLPQEQMKFQELLKKHSKGNMHINQPACPSLCSTWIQLVAPVYYLPFDPCGWWATTLETQILTKFEQVMDTRIKFLVQPPFNYINNSLFLSLSRHQSQGGHSHSSWCSWQEIK